MRPAWRRTSRLGSIAAAPLILAGVVCAANALGSQRPHDFATHRLISRGSDSPLDSITESWPARLILLGLLVLELVQDLGLLRLPLNLNHLKLIVISKRLKRVHEANASLLKIGT